MASVRNSGRAWPASSLEFLSQLEPHISRSSCHLQVWLSWSGSSTWLAVGPRPHLLRAGLPVRALNYLMAQWLSASSDPRGCVNSDPVLFREKWQKEKLYRHHGPCYAGRVSSNVSLPGYLLSVVGESADAEPTDLEGQTRVLLGRCGLSFFPGRELFC